MHWVSSFYKQKTLRSNQLHMLLHYILGTRFIFKSLMLSKFKGGGGMTSWWGNKVIRSCFVWFKSLQHVKKCMCLMCHLVVHQSLWKKATSKIVYISANFGDRELRFTEKIENLILAKLSPFSTLWMNFGLRPKLIPEPRWTVFSVFHRTLVHSGQEFATLMSTNKQINK